jgi:Flp pilus assembly protein TadG
MVAGEAATPALSVTGPQALLDKLFAKSANPGRKLRSEAGMFSRERITTPQPVASSSGRNLLVRFGRAEEGATAVEFGLISIPFLALLLALFQTAIIAFTAQVLESATENAARQIMTGQAQSTGMTVSQFRNLICPPASSGTSTTLNKIIDCSKLIIDVRSSSDFSSADTSKTIFTTPAQAQFTPGGSGSINVIRVMYQLPAYFSIVGAGNNIFGVSNGALANVILGAAVFRTEPYSSAS